MATRSKPRSARGNSPRVSKAAEKDHSLAAKSELSEPVWAVRVPQGIYLNLTHAVAFDLAKALYNRGGEHSATVITKPAALRAICLSDFRNEPIKELELTSDN